MTHRNVVLVCGGRDYERVDHVWMVLYQLHGHNTITRIVEGGATGADAAARRWAQNAGVPCSTMPADWKANGRAAGPIRNQKMLDLYEPDYVIAFPGGRGTKDMVTRAKASGYRVETYAPTDEQSEGKSE